MSNPVSTAERTFYLCVIAVLAAVAVDQAEKREALEWDKAYWQEEWQRKWEADYIRDAGLAEDRQCCNPQGQGCQDLIYGSDC